MTDQDASHPVRLPMLASSFYALVYLGLGLISLSTAYVQHNTAAVWIPSGYAVGLLLAKGMRYWPSVTAGSFLLNLSVNLGAGGDDYPVASAIVAAVIACGNTGEAVVGAYLTQRFANGCAFLLRARSLFFFLTLAVPLAPLVSTIVGVTASTAGAFAPLGNIFEIAMTWYVANAAGVLIFTGLTVSAFTVRLSWPPRAKLLEMAALALCLAFTIQAVCGFYLSDWMASWPKPYMIIPLLVWAAVRFGAVGGLIAIATVTAGASIGTMYDFAVFPADTPWRTLVYLQVFLAMLAVMTLAMTAALSEAEASRSDLEYRVEARTRAIEKLLGQREVFTALVAHDLQSPIYGLRNTLKTMGVAAKRRDLPQDDLIAALGIMEETCTTLADRIQTLLSAPAPGGRQSLPARAPLSEIIRNITTAHQLSLKGRNVSLVLDGPKDLAIEASPEVEHILDTLIDNAIRHSPPHGIIKIIAVDTAQEIRVSVADAGPGVPAEQTKHLFQQGEPSPSRSERRSKLGLFLAQQHAAWLGGRITYEPGKPQGAVFTLVLPRHAAYSLM